MSWFSRSKVVAEAGKGLFQAQLSEEKGSLRTEPTHIDNQLPHPSNIAEFEKHYRENAIVNAAINNLVDMTVGVGFYTEAEDERSKKAVDEYSEQHDLDGFLRVVCRNMLIYGFAPVERWWNTTLNLKPLPPQTVYAIVDRKGEVVGYKQRAWASIINFTTEEILWLSHNAYPGNPYGIGLIQPIYDLLMHKKQILEDICRIVHRYASPLNIWITKGTVQAIKQAVSDRAPDEDIFIGKASPEDLEIKTLEMDPRGKYTDYLEVINQEIYECLQAPLLTYLKNATEASANVQLEVIQGHVDGIQRYLKRKVEGEIFKPVISKAGLSEVPRLRWGRPSTGLEDISVEDIAKLVQAFVLTSGQAVGLLRKMGLPVEEAKDVEKNSEDEA